MIHVQERVSEVDLVSGRFPESFLRGIERQWAGSMKSLEQIRDQIVAAVERALPGAFNDKGSLVPIPVRTIVRKARLDRVRSHDRLSKP